MPIAISTLLILLALICFVLAGIGVGGRLNLVAWGLAFLTAAQLFYGRG